MADFRIVIPAIGGPEVLLREPAVPSDPGPGEVRIRHQAVGVNFIDTYHRTGLYPVPLPSGIGSEAAGVIEAIGSEVGRLRVGDRVAYATGPLGAYATVRTLPAAVLVPLPETVSSETAAAAMLKGMTCDMLTGACGRVQPGQTVLVHAAAGGVGSMLVQWLKAIGARVIAHAGSATKASRAAALGADEALSGPLDGLAATVRDLTGGRGVDIVFDGVGKASWAASLASLARRGLMVSYGNASGAVEPFVPTVLARAGSLYLTRPTLFDYVATPEELRASAARLFAMIGSGKVAVDIGLRMPLAQAAEARRALEARATSGSTILLP